jgi:hypothetical protein
MKGTFYRDGAYLAYTQKHSKNAEKESVFLLTKVTDT